MLHSNFLPRGYGNLVQEQEDLIAVDLIVDVSSSEPLARNRNEAVSYHLEAEVRDRLSPLEESTRCGQGPTPVSL